jgi:hypothetical protein
VLHFTQTEEFISVRSNRVGCDLHRRRKIRRDGSDPQITLQTDPRHALDDPLRIPAHDGLARPPEGVAS